MRIVVQSELVANEPLPARGDDPRVAAVLDDAAGRRGARRRRRRRGPGAPHPSAAGCGWPPAMDHEIDGARRHEIDRRVRGRRRPRHGRHAGCEPGQRLRVVKFLAYGWSSQRSRPALRDQVGAALAGARLLRLGRAAGRAARVPRRFWDGADVEVDGDAEVQQAVRFGLFHVLQAGARAERRPIPAKGLTGPGYDGHTFWDTETFVLPVLDLHRCPTRPPTRCAGGTRPSTWRQAAGRAARPAPARRSRGGRSAARSAPATGRPAPRPSTSTPTSPTRSIRYVDATGDEDFERESAWSCWSRPPGCGVAGPPRPRRAVPHRRRHRAGRVQRDRRRQRLHQPDGRSGTCSAAADVGRPPPRAGRASSASTERGDGRLAGRGRRRCTSPTTSELRRAPAGARASPTTPEWDFERDRDRPVPAAAALPVLRPLPQAGGQAGRPGAGDALRRRRVHAPSRRPATSTTTRR